MDSILKKSSRADRRFLIDGLCLAHDTVIGLKYYLSLYDLSYEGICLLGAIPTLKKGKVIHLTLDSSILPSKTLKIGGRIVGVTYIRTASNISCRYSLRFDRKLSEEEVISLLAIYALRKTTLDL